MNFEPERTTLERRIAAATGRVWTSRPVRRARAAYRAAREDLVPAPPVVHREVPDDVADAESVRAYLRDTDIFGLQSAESDDYLADAFDRFRLTMALVPDLGPQAEVLELGANPYFFTRLLARRGVPVTCANWFGANSGIGPQGSQTVTAPGSGEQHVFDFDHFNVEGDRFPYETGRFDLVLCCEILEHLPHDPTHLFAEIHRVLKKSTGTLILTTPNATRYDNLIRMVRGENVYEELSGYGVYGRHNREYTVVELRILLEELGYEVEEVFAADVHPAGTDRPAMPDMVEMSDRGDNLFAVARASGEPRWRYPRWLYSSQHAYRRRVRPDLVMGVNDELQANGFHPLEVLHGTPGRWTGSEDEAIVQLTNDAGGPAVLEVSGYAPPPNVDGSTELQVTVAGRSATATIEPTGQPFCHRIEFRDAPPGDHDVILRTSRWFVPRDIGINEDGRRLGIRVTSVRFVAAD